jgi:hypothetical protein
MTSRREAIAEAAPPGSAGKPARESAFKRLRTKLGIDPAKLHEGAIGGAFGGMLVGLATPIIIAFIKEAGPDESLPTAVGGVLAGIFFGCIIGFGSGILIGAVVGAAAKVFGWLFELTSRRAAILGGTITGASIAAIMGNAPLALIGAGLGCIGGMLWSIISVWAESSMTHSVVFTPKAAVDSTAQQRWELLDSPHDQGSYQALRKAR